LSRRLTTLGLFLRVALALFLIGRPVSARLGPELGISGTNVTIDGRPAFLLGVSLFDALGPTPPRDADLDALKAWGVNTVRVWAHWHEPIYQADGTLSTVGAARLAALVKQLQARGLILELVLLRPGQLPGQRYAVFASEDARLRAVDAITSALRDFRNGLFDLYNEHDHPDGPASHQALRAIRDRVKAIDRDRLVTVSSTESHLIGANGMMDDTQRKNLREEAGTDSGSVNVDIVAPHLPRSVDWAAAAGGRVGALRTALTAIGRPLPVYLDEEQRSAEGKTLPADAYAVARAAAAHAGAAGWVFHTDAGYELNKRPFLDALRPQERAGLAGLAR